MLPRSAAVASLGALLCLQLIYDAMGQQSETERLMLLGEKGHVYERYDRDDKTPYSSVSSPNTGHSSVRGRRRSGSSSNKIKNNSRNSNAMRTDNITRQIPAGQGRLRRHLTTEETTCRLWKVEIRYEEYEESHWECEFTNPDLLEATQAQTRDHHIIGTNHFDVDAFLDEQGAESGTTTLILSTGVELAMTESENQELHLGRNQVVAMEDNVIEVTENDDLMVRRGLADSIGNLRTLVVRVSASDTEPPSAEKLYDDMFGDEYCLKSQYKRCSFDKLNITEYLPDEEVTVPVAEGVAGGIVDVQININAVESSSYNLQRLANSAARDLFGVSMWSGGLNGIFDLVLFCLPPGSGSWVAYAYLNRWDSYYNGPYCGSLSATLHEVGHNLNLEHSGVYYGDAITQDYGDASGMMGFSCK